MTPDQVAFVERGRVARLATVGSDGTPHVVPVCYALLDDTVYVVLDHKPKRVEARLLARVRNIVAHPRIAFVVDHYDDDDWSRLGWVMLRGAGDIVEPGAEQRRALGCLAERYPQYRAMALDACPVIALRIERVTAWGDLSRCA